jgi:hypothetical protein
MNRKIFLVCAAIMVMVLGVAGFAYKRVNATTASAAMSCCGDSCPMKSKNATATADAKAGCDCCGDSCTMKSKNASSTADAKSCCDCCGSDSCPMKNGEHSKTMAGMDHGKMGDSCPMMKDAKVQNASATASTDAKKSCDCSCCNHNKDKAAAPAV